MTAECIDCGHEFHLDESPDDERCVGCSERHAWLYGEEVGA